MSDKKKGRKKEETGTIHGTDFLLVVVVGRNLKVKVFAYISLLQKKITFYFFVRLSFAVIFCPLHGAHLLLTHMFSAYNLQKITFYLLKCVCVCWVNKKHSSFCYSNSLIPLNRNPTRTKDTFYCRDFFSCFPSIVKTIENDILIHTYIYIIQCVCKCSKKPLRMQFLNQ